MTLFSKGLHDLGNGIYAYLQPDGSWGWSNAGLVTDSGEALLVDTLFDLNLTAEMLAEMRRATPAAARIETVVNTHANGDPLPRESTRGGCKFCRLRGDGSGTRDHDPSDAPADGRGCGYFR